MSSSWWARITCPDCGDMLVGVAMLAVDTDSGMVAVDCPYCGRRWRSALTADQLVREDGAAVARSRCAAWPRSTRPHR